MRTSRLVSSCRLGLEWSSLHNPFSITSLSYWTFLQQMRASRWAAALIPIMKQVLKQRESQCGADRWTQSVTLGRGLSLLHNLLLTTLPAVSSTMCYTLLKQHYLSDSDLNSTCLMASILQISRIRVRHTQSPILPIAKSGAGARQLPLCRRRRLLASRAWNLLDGLRVRLLVLALNLKIPQDILFHVLRIVVKLHDARRCDRYPETWLIAALLAWW